MAAAVAESFARVAAVEASAASRVGKAEAAAEAATAAAGAAGLEESDDDEPAPKRRREAGSPAGAEAQAQAQAEAPSCDIDVVGLLTADELMLDYLAAGRPVLVRGSMAASALYRRWRREAFREVHGAVRVQPEPYP